MEGSDRDREIESVMIVTTPPSKGIKSRKKKGEVEELSSPSVDAVSEKSLRETAPMILARWKFAAYKSSSEPRRLAEVVKEIEVSRCLVTEEDFKRQKAGSKKGSTNGQTWEVDVGKEWISSEYQAMGKQVTNDPLEKNATRNTARPWWVALETMKELEDCLKKLDHGVSRKRRNWATQQKAEVNKLKMGSQLKRTWQSLLRDYFEEAMRTHFSALPLMANPFVRTAGQLMFAWSLMGIELEVLTSRDKLKLGNKILEVYQLLVQHVARRKDAFCFLSWIMSVMTNITVQACHQKAMGSKTMERRVSTVILNVYQSTGIEKEDDSMGNLMKYEDSTRRNLKRGMMCIATWPWLRITRDTIKRENISTCLE